MYLVRIVLPVMALGITLSAVGGCVKRKEAITVARDGSVTFRIEHEGSADVIRAEESAPWQVAGWKSQTSEVREAIPENEGGGTKVKDRTIISEKVFPVGAELPDRWPTQNNDDAEVGLVFPTSSKVERRSDGNYYSFQRTYEPRRWAYIHYWEEYLTKFLKDENLEGTPIEKLPRDKILQIICALSGVEVRKQVALVRDALSECEPELSFEYRLRARGAMLAIYGEDYQNFGRLLDVCEQEIDDERDACFDREVKAVLSQDMLLT